MQQQIKCRKQNYVNKKEIIITSKLNIFLKNAVVIKNYYIHVYNYINLQFTEFQNYHSCLN